MLTSRNSATIFVSQQKGRDEDSGFYPRKPEGENPDAIGSGPFWSIDKALKAVQEMRQDGMFQPVTIAVDGDYYIDHPIEINPAVYRVTLTSLPGRRARIIGGRKLTGFKKDTFNGQDCYSLCLPDVQSGKWFFTDLYVNGAFAHPARWPVEGTLEAVTTEHPKSTALFNGSSWFIAKNEDLAKISGIENATVNFYHFWIDEHTPIEKVDYATGRIDLKYRSNFEITTEYDRDISSDLHYYLENIPQGFCRPGDWYLEKESGKLYYIPLSPDKSPDELEIFAPVVSRLFSIEGTEASSVSDIRLDGLDLLCTKGDYAAKFGDEYRAADSQSVSGAYGAVNFKYADNCSVTGCRLSCAGLYGINIEDGCHATRIEKNIIHDLGAGGVRIYGGKEAGLTTHCVIHGNRIRSGGHRHAAGCGVLAIDTSYCEISDNEICWFDYTGVSVGWVWGYAPSLTHHNLIRNNHIHHIGTGLLSDMGGIYTLGRQPGTVLEGNVIHDILSNHYGGWGIYPDEGSSYLLIRDNLVYDTKSESFHQHYGAFNTVRNNIFAYGRDKMIRNSRNEAHLSTLFEYNTIISRGKEIYTTLPQSIEAHDNTVWDTERHPVFYAGQTLKQWQSGYGKDEGTVVRNPHVDVYKLAKQRIERMDTVEEF